MKKYFILLIVCSALLLSSCNSIPDIYEYATTMLKEPDLLLAADGTVWRIGERNENGFADDPEIVDRLEKGTISTEVNKKNADDMELWEYTLLTADNRLDRYRTMAAVGADGSAWLISAHGSVYDAFEIVTAEEIGGERFIEGFWIEIKGVQSDDGEQGRPALLKVVLHDDSGTLIHPGAAVLEVLIDGQWYITNTSYADAPEMGSFDENGESFRATPLYAGYYYDIPLPSGHYRLRSYAYDDAEWQKYMDEKRETEFLELMRRYAVLEFDLTYKNGEYQISGIK